MSKGLKITTFIVGIAIIDIFILSKFQIGESPFDTAFAITMLVVSVVGLLFGISKIYFKSKKTSVLKTLKTNEDYVHALTQYKEIKSLKKDITFSLEQIERLKKKKETVKNVLNGRFEQTELTYQKFNSVISEVEALFYLNIRNIINKVSIYDENEYKSITQQDTSRFSSQILREKTEIYNDFLNFMKNAINVNEEILLDLDKLMLEISKLDNFEEIEKMPAMQEIDNLIKQTKYYKN